MHVVTTSIRFDVNQKGSSPKSSTSWVVCVAPEQSPNLSGPPLCCVLVLMNGSIEEMQEKCLAEGSWHIKGLINAAYYRHREFPRPCMSCHSPWEMQLCRQAVVHVSSLSSHGCPGSAPRPHWSSAASGLLYPPTQGPRGTGSASTLSPSFSPS